MKELILRYFWIVALSLCIGVPYIIWTAKSLFDIINSFRKTLKSRYNILSLTEQMKLYISDSTEYWIGFQIYVIMFITFLGGIISFLYYLAVK